VQACYSEVAHSFTLTVVVSSRASMSDNQEPITGITTPPISTDVPQFGKAEYAHIPGSELCKICGTALSGEYYRVNGLMACSKCANEAKDGQPKDSHVAFARALLFGVGGAVAGLALYATVEIVTNFTIGYLALAVGWLVATAMMKGSKGIGGRRYQVVAVVLTYFAISMAAVPVGVSYAIQHRSARHAQAQSTSSTPQASDTSTQVSAEPPAGQDGSNEPAQQAPSVQKQKTLSFGRAIATLLLMGIASPFLELASPGAGLIGLVILFVGLSIAFRMTKARPLDVDGPYSVNG